MKKIILICAALVFATLFVSCTKENSSLTKDDEDIIEDVYFVKYASNGLSGRYSVTYVDETAKTIKLESIAGSDFERIIGPVQTGFLAKFTITLSSSSNTAVRIEVKKNNEPFVVKKESTYGSVQYTL